MVYIFVHMILIPNNIQIETQVTVQDIYLEMVQILIHTLIKPKVLVQLYKIIHGFSDVDYTRVGAPSDDEMDMLELAFGLTSTSRLGCQITIDESLEGLTVKVPDDY